MKPLIYAEGWAARSVSAGEKAKGCVVRIWIRIRRTASSGVPSMVR